MRAAHPAASSLSLAGAENSTIKMELATALIAWETAWLAGAVGMARHRALNPQMGAQRDEFASSGGDGRGLCAQPGNTAHRRLSRSSTS